MSVFEDSFLQSGMAFTASGYVPSLIGGVVGSGSGSWTTYQNGMATVPSGGRAKVGSSAECAARCSASPTTKECDVETDLVVQTIPSGTFFGGITANDSSVGTLYRRYSLILFSNGTSVTAQLAKRANNGSANYTPIILGTTATFTPNTGGTAAATYHLKLTCRNNSSNSAFTDLSAYVTDSTGKYLTSSGSFVATVTPFSNATDNGNLTTVNEGVLVTNPGGVTLFEFDTGDTTAFTLKNFKLNNPVTASFAPSPTSVAVNTTGYVITLTGTGTNWVSGTTNFTLTGGTGASITAQAIAGPSSAMITINAGSSIGSSLLTISDGSASATISVSNGPATGYSLTGPSSGTVNTPSGNFTVALTPTGGTSSNVVITPSSSVAGSFSPANVTLSTANPTAIFVYTPTSLSASPASISVTNNAALTNPSALGFSVNAAPLSAGTLTFVSSSSKGPILNYAGTTGGTGTLTTKLHRANTTGFTPSAATVLAVAPVFPYNDSTGKFGTTYYYKIQTTDSSSTPQTINSNEQIGTLLNTTMKLGMIGDSLTINQGTTPPVVTSLRNTRFGRTVICSNQGVSGSATSSWTSSSSGNYATAKAAFNAAFGTGGMTHCLLMLGTNDASLSFSNSGYKTNIQAILANLQADFPGVIVFLSYPPYTGSSWNSNIPGYHAQLDSVANGSKIFVVGQSLYALFAENYQVYGGSDTNFTDPTTNNYYRADGIHLNAAGNIAIGSIWSQEINNALNPVSGIVTPRAMSGGYSA